MPAKKTTAVKKAAIKKDSVKPAPVMEHKCECGENCKCHCHGGAHLVKHIIVWAIIFALGMVCGKMIYGGHGPKHQVPKTHPVFVNGCLDMASVKTPMMKEKLAKADVDGNGCVSIEEYKAVRKEMKPAPKGMQGPKGKQGPKAPVAK